MTIRTSDTEVTFRRPFTLSAFDTPLPAGTYRVVIDDEEIPGLSFLAYRRKATILHAPAMSVRSGLRQVFDIDQKELAEALEADMLDGPSTEPLSP
jgi:hypothetical protein